MFARYIFLPLGCAVLLAPAMAGQHPEWGPEPPVAPYGHNPLPDQHVVHPLIFPVVGPCHWKDSYGDERGEFFHTGIDIQAPKMTPIVAPFAGLLGMKRESFWIYGDDGWAVLGTHLNDDNLGTNDHKGSRDLMFAPGLMPNQRVHSGEFIGYVGQSGDATGPHLHFELYAPGPGPIQSRIRDPFPSLKASQVLSAPVAFRPADKPEKGYVRFQGCIRKVEPSQHRMTIILSSRETSAGVATAITHVHYLRIHLPPPVVESVGGWSSISSVMSEHIIGVVVPDTAKLDDESAERLIL